MESCSRRRILVASTALISASTVAAITSAAQNLGSVAATSGAISQSAGPASSSSSVSGSGTTPASGGSGGAAGTSGMVPPTPGPSASASPSASPSAGQVFQREVYTATLSPANPNAPYGSATGQVTLVVDGGQVGVFIQANGLAPNIPHEQHIHAGSTCATLANDTNGDGYVSTPEAEAVAGQPLVAFTLNGLEPITNPQSPPNAKYPMAAPDGVETYIGSAPLSSLQSIMQTAMATPSPSTSPSPFISATPSTTPLIFPTASPTASPLASATPSSGPSAAAGTASGGIFDNHVVEIHGISDTFSLPGSVQAGVPGMTANQTLPVACGVLTRVTE